MSPLRFHLMKSPGIREFLMLCMYAAGASTKSIADRTAYKANSIHPMASRAGVKRPMEYVTNSGRRARKHGTLSTYAHGCRCELCSEANTGFHRTARQERAERLARDPSIVVHGRASTYTNWCCRCLACITAHAEECRKHAEARKAKAS